MTELIVTEKPSTAKKLAEALADKTANKKKNKQISYYELTHEGKPIIIASAVGHLYGLVENNKQGWTYPVFDIKWEASYKSSKDLNYVKNYIDTISELAKKADSITVATDYDVEGEVIGLNAVRYACKKPDANRMKFSTLTKGDLIESYQQKLPHLDWGQANAGETRHKLDWFYGINLSRALTSSVKAAGSFKVMSAGRVQGPALKLLVDCERSINAFKPEPYWEINLLGKCNDANNSQIEAQHSKGKIFDKEIVSKILETTKNEKQAKVTAIKRTKRQQQAPYPFDLTTLQSESYSHFKITPKETLAIAQSLYLAGVTSYPRTSSQKLDPKLGFQKILDKLSKQPVYKELANSLLKLSSLKPNNGKKSDPAHPAIYPTGLVPGELKPRERKVYDLIVKRFMATFAAPAVRETMEVSLDVKSELFLTKGTRTLEENWHVYYKPYVKLDEVTLPGLKENDVVNIEKITKEDKETQPPRRFNQSSIIKELEKRNLGTKATRADILERLFQRGYVEGVQIKVTELGMQTVEILEKYAEKIVDEALTAEIEEELEKIREGKTKMDTVLDKAIKFLTELLADFKKKEKQIGADILQSIKDTRDIANYLGTCPNCGEGRLMIKRGKFGRFAGCDNYPECKTIVNIPKTGKIKFIEMCDKCSYPIIEAGTGRSKRKSCVNQSCPSRGGTAEGETSNGNGSTEKTYPEEGMACPTCNKGQMVLRKSFYGQFLGCNNYPSCQTMMKIVEGKVQADKPIVKTGSAKKTASKGRKKTTAKKTTKAKAKSKAKK